MTFFKENFKHIAAFIMLMNAAIVFAQPQIQFINTTVNVGDIYEGEMPEVKYAYKNTGNQPLRVNQVKSSCGCYSPSWESDSTPPSATDTIRARYNSVAHIGGISKSIYVATNAGEKDIELTIGGSVKTFAPDLHLYYGGNISADFRVKEDAKTGQKSIAFQIHKGMIQKGPLTLVLANTGDKPKKVAIVETVKSKTVVGIRVLKNELATNKLNFISPESFTITRADSEILYLTLLKEENTSFDLLIDAQVVNVRMVVDGL